MLLAVAAWTPLPCTRALASACSEAAHCGANPSASRTAATGASPARTPCRPAALRSLGGERTAPRPAHPSNSGRRNTTVTQNCRPRKSRGPRVPGIPLPKPAPVPQLYTTSCRHAPTQPPRRLASAGRRRALSDDAPNSPPHHTHSDVPHSTRPSPSMRQPHLRVCPPPSRRPPRLACPVSPTDRQTNPPKRRGAPRAMCHHPMRALRCRAATPHTEAGAVCLTRLIPPSAGAPRRRRRAAPQLRSAPVRRAARPPARHCASARPMRVPCGERWRP